MGRTRKDSFLPLLPSFRTFEKEIQPRMQAVIERSKELFPSSYLVGREREERVAKALEKLKSQGNIVDFMETGKGSYHDLILDTDFYVVLDEEGKRIALPLSCEGTQHPNRKNTHRRVRIRPDECEDDDCLPIHILWKMIFYNMGS